ncbi:hypothetical protein GQX74_008344 [Glossina fuscipes]|nr:hypothetical protein GQX74_008344 [Glossina fuscipes]
MAKESTNSVSVESYPKVVSRGPYAKPIIEPFTLGVLTIRLVQFCEPVSYCFISAIMTFVNNPMESFSCSNLSSMLGLAVERMEWNGLVMRKRNFNHIPNWYGPCIPSTRDNQKFNWWRNLLGSICYILPTAYIWIAIYASLSLLSHNCSSFTDVISKT